jgi:hypothetical protein
MNVFKKELYVALQAQTVKFRIVKYIVLIAIFGAIYWWKGGEAVLWSFLIALVFALAMHFFFRWKSKGWMEDYGPYKSLFKKE